MSKVVMNNELVDAEQAVLSIFDHGVAFGMGVFETIRCKDGVPLLWDKHMARLKNSLLLYGIDLPFEASEWLLIAQKLCHYNGIVDGVLKIQVAAGEEVGLFVEKYTHPTWFMTTRPLPTSFLEWEAVVVPMDRVPPETPVRIKSAHYANNLLAKRALGNSGGKEGLFLRSDRIVVEGITSNVFFVNNNQLVTPSLLSGCLPGVMREVVLQLAVELGIEVVESLFTLDDVSDATEMFFTNAVQGVMPVKQLEGFKEFAGALGPIAEKLRNKQTLGGYV